MFWKWFGNESRYSLGKYWHYEKIRTKEGMDWLNYVTVDQLIH